MLLESLLREMRRKRARISKLIKVTPIMVGKIVTEIIIPRIIIKVIQTVTEIVIKIVTANTILDQKRDDASFIKKGRIDICLD